MQETLFESGCEIRYMFRRVFSPDKTVRQYSSNRYQAMLAQNKIKGSMSKAGYPYDNSPMESFFASLKKEYFYRREYATIQDVERDLFYYIEVFYKRKKTSQQLRYHEPGSLQDEEDGPKSWIVSKYVYGIKAHYKTDYQSR